MSGSQQCSRVFTVDNSLGLHARPATLFVKTAQSFESEIYVARDSQRVDGKSILGLIMLAAEQGIELEVTALGNDAMEALDALEELFRDKFGED